MAGFVVLLIAAVVGWLYLAHRCVVKGRPWWILAAIVVPIPVFFIAVSIARATVETTGGLDDLGRGIAAGLTVLAVTALSSFVLLGIGAGLPEKESGDGREWPTSRKREGPSGDADSDPGLPSPRL